MFAYLLFLIYDVSSPARSSIQIPCNIANVVQTDEVSCNNGGAGREMSGGELLYVACISSVEEHTIEAQSGYQTPSPLPSPCVAYDSRFRYEKFVQR